MHSRIDVKYKELSSSEITEIVIVVLITGAEKINSGKCDISDLRDSTTVFLSP